jgi:DNA-directed RNA polymerase specialized sigma24 family protein
VVTGDVMSRARTGDGDAFRELTEPHRQELLVHCYRMLGSLQDAEDALQDSLLAAAKEWDVPNVEPPEPTRLGKVVWLEPFPDARLEGVIDVPLGPQARYEQTESISLAFVTALQVVPPRQLAVLILRDVLGFHANEVADMLNSTVESANSALNGRAPPCSAQRYRLPTANRLPLRTHPPRMRSWRNSSARGSPPISTRWWTFWPARSFQRKNNDPPPSDRRPLTPPLRG